MSITFINDSAKVLIMKQDKALCLSSIGALLSIAFFFSRKNKQKAEKKELEEAEDIILKMEYFIQKILLYERHKGQLIREFLAHTVNIKEQDVGDVQYYFDHLIEESEYAGLSLDKLLGNFTKRIGEFEAWQEKHHQVLSDLNPRLPRLLAKIFHDIESKDYQVDQKTFMAELKAFVGGTKAVESQIGEIINSLQRINESNIAKNIIKFMDASIREEFILKDLMLAEGEINLSQALNLYYKITKDNISARDEVKKIRQWYKDADALSDRHLKDFERDLYKVLNIFSEVNDYSSVIEEQNIIIASSIQTYGNLVNNLGVFDENWSKLAANAKLLNESFKEKEQHFYKLFSKDKDFLKHMTQMLLKTSDAMK